MAGLKDGRGGAHNQDPWQARLKRAQQRKPWDLAATMRHTCAVLSVTFEAIGEAKDDESRRRWVLAYSQLLGGYIRLHEVGELEPRLKAMEKAIAQAHREA